MRESKIEAYLRKQVRAHGGLCWKLVSPGLIGVPDRIVILGGGRTVWVELKAPGAKPRESQLRRHAELQALGHTALVIDSMQGVDDFIEKYLIQSGKQ